MIEKHDHLRLKRSHILATLAGLTFAFLLGAAAIAYLHDAEQAASAKVADKFDAGPDSVLRPTVYESNLPSVTQVRVQNAPMTTDASLSTTQSLEYKAAPVPDLVQAGSEQDKSGFCMFSDRRLETPERYLQTHDQEKAAADAATNTTAGQP